MYLIFGRKLNLLWDNNDNKAQVEKQLFKGFMRTEHIQYVCKLAVCSTFCVNLKMANFGKKSCFSAAVKYHFQVLLLSEVFAPLWVLTCCIVASFFFTEICPSLSLAYYCLFSFIRNIFETGNVRTFTAFQGKLDENQILHFLHTHRLVHCSGADEETVSVLSRFICNL